MNGLVIVARSCGRQQARSRQHPFREQLPFFFSMLLLFHFSLFSLSIFSSLRNQKNNQQQQQFGKQQLNRKELLFSLSLSLSLSNSLSLLIPPIINMLRSVLHRCVLSTPFFSATSTRTTIAIATSTQHAKCFSVNTSDDAAYLAYKKKLQYRSNHRGMRENDLILGSFASEHLNSLSPEELRQYEFLLDQPDPELFSWFTGKASPPSELKNNPLLLRLCSYTHTFKQSNKWHISNYGLLSQTFDFLYFFFLFFALFFFIPLFSSCGKQLIDLSRRGATLH